MALESLLSGKTLKSLKLGPNFTKISSGCFNNFTANKIEFEADIVEISKDISIKFSSLKPPKQFIIKADSIQFDLQAVMNSSLNTTENNYTLANDELILSDTKYNYPCIKSSLSSSIYKLVIEDSARYIGSGLFDSISFSSVTINSGLETLLSDISTTSQITIPASVTNMTFHTYSSSSIVFDSGSPFIFDNEFLVSQDKTVVYGCYSSADISNLPIEVTTLGAYSLSGLSFSSFNTSNTLVNIYEYALPSSCAQLNLGNSVQILMRQSGVTKCSIIPSSLKYIDLAILAGLSNPVSVQAGCTALQLINEVWYYIREDSYSIAISVQNPNACRIDFIYNEIYEYCVKSINNETIKKITNTNQNNYSLGSNFIYYEYLSGRIQNFWDINSNYQDFTNTNMTGNLRLPLVNRTINGVETEFCSYVDMYSIPIGVLHVYAKRKLVDFRVQFGSPWIHVPPDSGLIPDDFGWLPLIYDWVNETDANDEIDDNEDVCNDYDSSETDQMSSEIFMTDQSNDYLSGNDSSEGLSESNSASNSNDSSGSTDRLSSGEVAGIVIGCVVFVALVVAFAFWWLSKKKVIDNSPSDEEIEEIEEKPKDL